jgi:DNA-binding NarL/FixJ family response regulator
MSRILIADGSDIVRKMLKLLLEAGTGWTVCGEAIDGNEALLKARELKPDVVILDLAMSGMNGLFVSREILKFLPTATILLHTVNNIPAVIAEAKKYGIRRVIGKGEDGERLLSAIREELDARPKGIAALLEETANHGANAEPSEAPAEGSENGPGKATGKAN